MTSPLELLDVARTIAAEARDLVTEGRRRAQVQRTKSSDVDIVTQMDIAAERLLRERLAELRPGDGILGEEDEAVAGTTGVTWVIDPIDGTVNYLYGIPHWSVSVAAVSGSPDPHAWTLEAGAVAAGGGEMWTAARGHGAWCDDEPLAAGARPPLAGSLVATGFQYTVAERAQQGALAAGMLPLIRDLRRLGSASIDLCHAAAGLVDAYYEHGLHAWDFAAGALVAQEAGLRVAGLDGGAADERLLIAAHPEVWDALHAALVGAGARGVGTTDR